MNPTHELIEAIAKRMGISVAEATEVVSMVKSSAATHPESAPQPTSNDTKDTFFFEGDEPLPRTETMLPDEEALVQRIGRYHKLGTLGIGGMGEVFRVLDPSLNRILALKVIHPQLMTMPVLVSRFVEEAQIQANLQHPNIVPIHEIGRLEDNRPYFTMRLVQDDPYSEQIDAVHKAASATQWQPTPNGTTFRDLIRTFHQVCVTVAFAHAQRVIHRDLKPDNILIGRFGQVLVVDWGLAKFIGASIEEEDALDQIDTLRPRVGSNQTRVGSVSGTPAYMSPEQARGETKNLGPPTDVYALGAILYELLTGEAPFQGSSSAEILEQVREHEPKEGLVLVRIPTHLKALCKSAMQRDLAERTLSAEELAQGLKGWLEGAEKRDKGLKELESARQVLAEIQQFENQSEAEWEQANVIIQSEGAESETGWEFWNKTKATQVKIRALRVRHRRRLQGALVHAPELEEAHNALAELVLTDIVRANALGDVRSEGVLVQQFTGHLEHLGPLAREKLETQLEIGRSDPIAGRRMRQGAIVGRRAQRQSIGEQFRSGNRQITLLGTAGVGKTRLALEVAEDLHDLEHVVTFCDLTEATDAMGIVRRLARAMDVRLRDMEPMAHLCEILGAQRTLLILDNLEQVQAIIGPLIQKWIGKANHLLILATSRVRLMVETETVVAIQPLALLESVELFVARGQTADQRFALTPDNRIQVCQIVRQLDGLPLAIELAAARLKLLTLDEIGSHLENRFGLLRSRGKDARALDTALDWSWSLLEPWAKAALSQASLFQGGFNLAAATGVIQKGEFDGAPEIFDVLGGLVDNSLLRLEHNEAGVRYSLLESIRAYANNKLGDPTEGEPSLWGPEARVRAQHHHAAYFSKFGKPASLRALKGFESSAQWDGLFMELDNLVAAIDYGTPESAPLCCLAALKILGMKGPVALGVDIATQVMKMPGLNRRSHSLLEIERGKCLRISGRMGEARSMVHSLPPTQPVAVEAESETKAEAPEPLSREAGLVEAARLMELGRIEQAESKYFEAEQCFRRSLEIYLKYRARHGEASVIGNLGNVYREKGQHDSAVAYYSKAIAILREIGDKSTEGINLGNLGNTYKVQGLFDSAVEHYIQAIDIAQEIGNRRSEGINLGNLGDVFVKIGQLDKAEETVRKAISICDQALPAAAGTFRASLALLLAQKGQLAEGQELLEVGEPQVATYPAELAKFLCKKGQVQILADQPEAAQKSLDQAKAIATEHKFGDDGEVAEAINELTALLGSSDDSPDEDREDALIEAERLMELGRIEASESKYSQAEQCYLSALEIFQKLGDRAGEGVVIGNLGGVYQQQGQYDQAVEHYTQSIDLAREVGDKRSEGMHLGNLGNVYKNQGQHDRAVEHYTHAIDISREIGNKRSEGNNLGNLGGVYHEQGRHDRAVEHLTHAIDIAREIGDKRHEVTHLGNLGTVFQEQGQHDRAVEHYTHAIDISREIGNKRFEGIFLGNLGDMLSQQNRLEEAEEAFRKSVLISNEACPPAAGAFRASLALLLAQKGQIDEAQALLETGEPQVATYPSEFAKFLCKKGQVQLLAGEPEAAQKSLDQARALATEHKFGDTGEVAEAINQVTALLGSPDEPDDEEREDAWIEAERLLELGNIERAESKYAEAEKCYLSALDISKKHGYRAGERAAIGNLGTVYREKGQNYQAVEHYTQAIDIARELGDKRGEGINLTNLGVVYKEQGEHDRAVKHFNQAIDIARELGDKRGEGIILGNLGTVFQEQKQHDWAVEHYTQAIDIAKEIGNKRGEGIHLGNLGDAFVTIAQRDKAEEAFRKAIPIVDETFPPAAGAFRASLALLLAQKGQIDEAQALLETGESQVAAYPSEHAKFLCKKGQVQLLAGAPEAAQKALDQAKALAAEHKFGDAGEVAQAIAELTALLGSPDEPDDPDEPPGEEREDALIEASRLMELGAIERAESKYAEAERCYINALEIYQKHGDRGGEGTAIGNLGNVYREKGQNYQAVEHYTQAIDIAREIGDKRGEGINLGNLGTVFQEQKQHDRAVEHYTQAIDIAKEIGNKRGEGINLGNLGNVYRAQGQNDRAAEHYTHAIDIAREIGDKGSEGINLGNLGIAYQNQGQYSRAAEHFTQAIDIAREIGDKRGEGIILGNLGTVFQEQGQHDRAVEHYTHAIDISREIGNKRFEGIFLGNLGDMLSQQNRLEEAEEAFRKSVLISNEACPPAAGAFRASLALLLAQNGQIDEAQALLETGESQVAAYPSEHAKFLCKKGQVQLLAGEPEAAQKALDQAKAVAIEYKFGDDGEVAEAIAELSALLGSSDDPDEPAGEDREDALIEAERLLELGNIEQAESKYAEAERCYHRALEIFQKHGERVGEGETIGNLGSVYQHQGQHDRAGEHLTQAIYIAREIGDKHNEGKNLGNLGLVYQNQGQHDRAVEHLTQANDIAREIGDQRSEGMYLGCLGIVYQNQGKHDRAAEHFTQAIDIAREIGNKSSEGIHLGNLGGVYREQGQHDQAAEYFTRAIEIAKEIGNKSNEGIHLGNLGNIYKEQGLLDRAAEHFTQAIDIAREIGNKSSEGINLGNLGITYQNQGQYDRSVAHYTQAINIAREIGDKRTEGSHLGNLGDMLFQQNRLEEAEDAFRKSIPIGDETFPLAAGAFRGSLALLLAQKGQFDEAQTLLETGEPQVAIYPSELAKFLCKKGQVQLLADDGKAAQKSLDQAKAFAAEHKFGDDGEVAEAIAELTALLGSSDDPDDPDEPAGEDREDALIEAERLMELGNIERAESKYAEAERCYRSALEIFQQHGDRAGEGKAIGNLGSIHRNQGQHDQAVEHYTQAIDIAREIGDKRTEGTNLGNLGNIYKDQGQYDRAVKHFTLAIDIAREIGDKPNEGINLGNLGSVYQQQGQADRAAEHYTQAIDIAREIGNKRSESHNLGSLGNVYQEQGQYDRAVEHYTQAIDIAREIGDKRFTGNHLGNLGLVYQKQGQHDRAIEHFTQAIDIAREIGNKGSEGINLGNLGDTFVKIAQLSDAEDAFRKAIHIGDETFPVAAGVFRGSLALLLAQQDQFDEAQTLLEIGEPQVATHPLEHAKFLCKKGQVQLLAGEPEAAQKSLDQAKSIAAEHKFGDDGDVAQAIAELTALLGSLDEPDDPDEPPGEEREDALIEASRLMELGAIERAESKYAEAERCYINALEIYQKHGDRGGEGTAIGHLGSVHHRQGQHAQAVEHLTQALDIARDIGDKRTEGSHLGNLGDMLFQQNRLEEAEEAFRKSIPIGDETFPIAAGAFRGSLALLLAQQDQFDEAHELLKIGEPQIASHPGEHAKFLCKKGHVQLLAGEPKAAQESLDKAKELVAEHKLGDDSEVAEASSELAALLDSPDEPDEPADEEREDALIEAERLLELGNIEREESKYAEAERCYLRALEIFQKHGDRAGEGQAIGKLGIVYIIQGQQDRAVKHYTQAIDIAREIGDKHSEGSNLCNLGIVYQEQGDLNRASELYTESLNIAREMGNKPTECVNLCNLGNVYQVQGQYDRAVEHHSQALDIAREIGDKGNEGARLGSLGSVYHSQGQHDLAVEHYTQAIDIAKEIGDKRPEGIHLGNLGDTFVKLEQFDKAEEAFREAILINDEAIPFAAGAFRASLALLLAQKGQFDEAQTLLETGEAQVAIYPNEHAKFLCKKGQVQLLTGEPEAAQKALDQAKAIAAEHKFGDDSEVAEAIAELTALLGSSDDPDEPAGEEREDALIEAARLMELGNIERAESKYAEAEKCYLSALEIYQKHGDRAGEGETTGNLGNLYQQKGQHDWAVEHLTQAIDIAKEIGDKPNEGMHLGILGSVYRQQGQHGRAVEHYTQAIEIAREIGDNRTEGTHLGNLGGVYKVQGQYDRAIEHFTQAIDIAKAIGNRSSEGIHLGNLGGVYQDQGQYDWAAEHYTQAIDIAREVGNRHNEGGNLGNLGIVYKDQGQHDRAAEHLTQAIDIAREIGNKHAEGINLGNLGDAFVKMEQLDKAEEAFRKAIPISDEAIPVAAGAFRASLALLLAQQDQLDEAQDLIKIGEPQVAVHPLEHAKFLCKKGQVQLLADEPKAAQDSLDQAKAIATEHQFGDDGEVAQAIGALERLLS